MSAPGPLRPGDRVALLTVSGPPAPAQVARGTELVRSWGLQPVPYPSLTAVHEHASYLAGPDALRARDLEDAWCDPTIDAILLVRGGYGAVRMLDLLDVPRMRAAGVKPLFGSSDVTALHEWIGAHLRAPTWFAPMIATGDLLDDAEATAHLRAALLEDPAGRIWERPGAEVLVPGTATGPLVGGTLALLAETLAARHQPATSREGAIVLLEDVGEDTYRLDGFLQSLLRAGWFDGAAAILCGSWKRCEVGEVRALVRELLAPLGLPLVWEFGFGHGPGAFTLPLGVPVHLDAPAPGGAADAGRAHGTAPRLTLA